MASAGRRYWHYLEGQTLPDTGGQGLTGPRERTPLHLDANRPRDHRSKREVKIATRRADGTLRTARIVWIVRHGDALYVRSVNGRDAAWYRGVQTRHSGVVTAGRVSHNVNFAEAGDHAGNETGLDDALDEAYRAKYGRSSSAVKHITAEQARATTLRVDRALLVA